MATKRKNIAQLKPRKTLAKRLKEATTYSKHSTPPNPSNSNPLHVQNGEESDTGKSLTSKQLKSQNGDVRRTIISCFRKQKQLEVKRVKCPVCQRMVLFQKINQHLDGDCGEDFLDRCDTGLSISNCRTSRQGSQRQINNNNGYSEDSSGPAVDPFNTSLVNDFINHDLEKAMTVSDVHDDIGTTSACKSGSTALSLDDNFMPTNNTSSTTNDMISKVSNCGNKSPVPLNENFTKNSTSNSSKDFNHLTSSSKLGEVTIVYEIENSLDAVSAEQIILDREKDSVNVNKVNLGKNVPESPHKYQNNLSISQSDEIPVETDEKGSRNADEPYYLQNFMLTLNTVLSHKDDRELFDKEDSAVVTSFRNLSDGAKKLYVRLFQRKFKWFQKAKIQYPRISENLHPFFQELIGCGFVQTEDKLLDLEEILKLLPAPDIQELAKSMHILNKNEGKTKKQLTQSLLKHSQKQCSLFANNGNRIEKAIVKRAKTLLGPSVKLESFPRNVFSRVLLLFTLNLLADDDDSAGSQLSALFLINIGRVVYPAYNISRETSIFRSRDELIQYEMANRDLCRMDDAIENKNFEEALNVYKNIKGQFLESLDDLAKGEPRLANSVKLPIHLRRFTCTWLYTKMCSKGVELLQRNKEYTEAVDLLRLLLGQNEFCVSRRGWWWERLALNLDQHLKKPSEALDAVREGLSDERVRTGHRLALEQRARKICETKRNSSLRKHLTEIRFTELKQPKVVTISGKRLNDEPVFVLHEVNTDGSVDGDVVSYCGVEEMALRYYRQQGYNEGIHGEGSTFNSLYGLLMWDVIFADGIPDVFRTPFQAAPLDIYCDNFYVNRKEIIRRRLDEIRNASAKDLVEWIECTWEEQQGKTCVGINWDLFSGVEQVKELARCIGSSVIAGICERFAKDYRHTRSGLPDLVVWSSSSLKYKIVEVKGPNDRLSTKQHVWLDVLVSLGVDAEVLYVKAVGGRML